jgi:apolipoprotein D and lipocalin family protein
MKWILLLPVLLAAWFVSGCQSSPKKPLSTVQKVDLQRYVGTWHEIARLPKSFQRENERARAEYTALPDGSVRVVNTAIRPDGSTREARGRAEAVPGSNNARLRVRFEGLAALAPNPKEGNYWIIALDEARYEYAMVGTPHRKFLWILARSPNLDASTAKQLVARAQALGFPTKQLLWNGRPLR